MDIVRSAYFDDQRTEAMIQYVFKHKQKYLNWKDKEKQYYYLCRKMNSDTLVASKNK